MNAVTSNVSLRKTKKPILIVPFEIIDGKTIFNDCHINEEKNNDYKKIKKTKKNKTIITNIIKDPSEKTKLWELFNININNNTNIKVDEVDEDDSSQLPLNVISELIDISVKNQENLLMSTSLNSQSIDELYCTMHLCKMCDSVLLIMEDGVPTCTNIECGIIYKDVIDYSPEWRYYNSGDNKKNVDPTRCGNPINPLLKESSFGCKILCNNKSSFEMKRIRKWTEWTSAPHREKSLYEEFQFISTMAQNSGIPKIFIDYAMMIHKDISEQKMFRGMNRDGIKSASIYISCRLNGCPRTSHEIAEIFKLDKQSTTAGCSNAVKILNNIERNVEYSQKSDFKTTTASSFIERYCSKLGIPQELTLLAKFIAVKTEHTDLLCNNTPQSSAAGIIYFITQSFHLGISKVNIRIICGVSEVTIGKCSKKLETIKDKLIPQCIIKKYIECNDSI